MNGMGKKYSAGKDGNIWGVTYVKNLNAMCVCVIACMRAYEGRARSWTIMCLLIATVFACSFVSGRVLNEL